MSKGAMEPLIVKPTDILIGRYPSEASCEEVDRFMRAMAAIPCAGRIVMREGFTIQVATDEEVAAMADAAEQAKKRASASRKGGMMVEVKRESTIKEDPRTRHGDVYRPRLGGPDLTIDSFDVRHGPRGVWRYGDGEKDVISAGALDELYVRVARLEPPVTNQYAIAHQRARVAGVSDPTRLARAIDDAMRMESDDSGHRDEFERMIDACIAYDKTAPTTHINVGSVDLAALKADVDRLVAAINAINAPKSGTVEGTTVAVSGFVGFTPSPADPNGKASGGRAGEAIPTMLWRSEEHARARRSAYEAMKRWAAQYDALMTFWDHEYKE